LNIHASLLPRWRGAAPIQRAIEAGDASTGITLMQMDAGLDTGAMLLAQALPIADDDTASTLHDRLAELGGRLVVQGLAQLQAGALRAEPQPEEGVSYAHKIHKAEGPIDWALPATVLERLLRAFDPFPGASTELLGRPVKLWRGRVLSGPVKGSGAPGEVILAAEGRLVVACGDGALEVLELQEPGGRRTGAADFLRRCG
jgi:methionyl-tRNA formyltransferase